MLLHLEPHVAPMDVVQPITEGGQAMSDIPKFEREIRYQVIKLKTGKPVDCVVVEKDWPEYEVVWQMIQDRVEGRQNELSFAELRVAELEAALKEYGNHKKGCGVYWPYVQYCDCGFDKVLGKRNE